MVSEIGELLIFEIPQIWCVCVIVVGVILGVEYRDLTDVFLKDYVGLPLAIICTIVC